MRVRTNAFDVLEINHDPETLIVLQHNALFDFGWRGHKKMMNGAESMSEMRFFVNIGAGVRL